VQGAAIAFYRRSGYRLVRTELANAMSTKTVGGGLRKSFRSARRIGDLAAARRAWPRRGFSWVADGKTCRVKR
jgi:hypothetical protein